MIWAGLFGLVVGSFLNVVIYRMPRMVAVSKGRSCCPSCDRQLRWFHNIPILSYLFLRGRCAFCSEPISVRYPLVELANSLLYLYCFSRFGFSWEFVIFAYLSSALLAIFFIDLEFQIIPDLITLPGIILGLAAAFVPGGLGIIGALVGLAAGGGSLYLIALLGDWLFKKESMGGGDIKMAAMLGAFLGWQKILLIFLSASIIGLVASIALMAFSEKLRRTRLIPFGPFLATAAMLAIVYGQQIIDFYVVSFLRLQ